MSLYDIYRERVGIMFQKTMWTKEKAREYLKKKNLKSYHLRTHRSKKTGLEYWYFKLTNPRDDFVRWEEYRAKHLGKGIVEIHATNVMNF